jgi:hypothetical protein
VADINDNTTDTNEDIAGTLAVARGVESNDEAQVSTEVVNTEVHGPAQRDRAQAWQDDTFADLSLARKRDESAAEAEREQSRRHAEEMFDRRVRLADALNTIVIQTLTASNVDTTVADSAVVDSLVGIIDKLTALVPPANTGS